MRVESRRLASFARRQEGPRVRPDRSEALEPRGPFRRLEDALLRHPEVRTRWFAFAEERLLACAREWLPRGKIRGELVIIAPSDLPLA